MIAQDISKKGPALAAWVERTTQARYAPNGLFPHTFDHGDFIRLLQNPDPARLQCSESLKRLAARALAHPASYRSQTAHLQTELETLLHLAGCSYVALRLLASRVLPAPPPPPLWQQAVAAHQGFLQQYFKHQHPLLQCELHPA